MGLGVPGAVPGFLKEAAKAVEDIGNVALLAKSGK